MERDPYLWKKTHTYEKRPRTAKRLIHKRSQQICICGKRPMYVERDPYLRKKTHTYEKRPRTDKSRIHERYTYVERDLCTYKGTHIDEERPTRMGRDLGQKTDI